MNIDEVKQVVDRILAKREDVSRFEKLKTFIDDRTDPTGKVTITIEKESFEVDPADVKAMLTKQIQTKDTASDEAELKQKAK